MQTKLIYSFKLIFFGKVLTRIYSGDFFKQAQVRDDSANRCKNRVIDHVGQKWTDETVLIIIIFVNISTQLQEHGLTTN